MQKNILIIWAFTVAALIGAGFFVSSMARETVKVSRYPVQKNLPALSNKPANTTAGKQNVQSTVRIVSNNVTTSARVR